MQCFKCLTSLWRSVCTKIYFFPSKLRTLGCSNGLFDHNLLLLYINESSKSRFWWLLMKIRCRKFFLFHFKTAHPIGGGYNLFPPRSFGFVIGTQIGRVVETLVRAHFLGAQTSAGNLRNHAFTLGLLIIANYALVGHRYFLNCNLA